MITTSRSMSALESQRMCSSGWARCSSTSAEAAISTIAAASAQPSQGASNHQT